MQRVACTIDNQPLLPIDGPLLRGGLSPPVIAGLGIDVASGGFVWAQTGHGRFSHSCRPPQCTADYTGASWTPPRMARERGPRSPYQRRRRHPQEEWAVLRWIGPCVGVAERGCLCGRLCLVSACALCIGTWHCFRGHKGCTRGFVIRRWTGPL